MPITIQGKTYYHIKEALTQAGISESTWRRWIKNNVIEDVKTRDRRGWRLFTQEDIQRIKDYAETITTA